jgi:hypothetical protein
MPMSESTTNTTGENASNSQESTTPKPSPSPTPSSFTKEPAPTTESRHAAPEQPADESGQQDQAYLDKHASLRNRDGEGSPGDISGYATSTENPGAHPADFSNVTGRDQVDDSER